MFDSERPGSGLSDPESWRRRGIADRVGSQVDLPDPDLFVTRGGARRQRRRAATSGTVAVLAVAVITLGGAWWGGGLQGDSDPEPPVATTHTEAPSVTEADEGSIAAAERMVDGQNAYLDLVAIDPADDAVRAALWRCTRACGGVRAAVVVSDDGFATRRIVPVSVDTHRLQALGEGSFFAGALDTDSFGQLITPEGATSLADGPASADAPATDAEVIAALGGSGYSYVGFVAVNPVTHARHPIPLPISAGSISNWAAGEGRIILMASDYEAVKPATTYWWSDDGGATWGSQVLKHQAPNEMVLPVATARGADHQVIVSGDGATLMPLVAVHRGDASGKRWRREEYGAQSTLNGFATLGNELVVGQKFWNEGQLYQECICAVRPDGGGPVGPPLDADGAGEISVMAAVDASGLVVVSTYPAGPFAWRKGEQWEPYPLR